MISGTVNDTGTVFSKNVILNVFTGIWYADVLKQMCKFGGVKTSDAVLQSSEAIVF